ncbi:MAG: hypothetical protein GTO18_11080 [Anaerolineales bacterium]|nr:hypothetical protein [Anaerolineales bacterium]
MNPKGIFILAILLIILFGAGISLGITSSDRNLEDPLEMPQIKSLDELLTRALTTDELEVNTFSTCRVEHMELAVFGDGPCEIEISKTFIPVTRELSLRIIDGTRAMIELKQPDTLTERCEARAPGAELPLIPLRLCKTLDVYRDGGILLVDCDSSCRLRLE